ncbi:30S ribosomal protein S31 [Luteibacter sp. Sphag1AF]|nr:30S ribosomal protein S31 [Luteibacter sp. Sphag1AF]
MGKGDRRTRRGKIYRASYGKARPHTDVVTGVVAKPAAVKAAPAAKKAAAPRKKSA